MSFDIAITVGLRCFGATGSADGVARSVGFGSRSVAGHPGLLAIPSCPVRLTLELSGRLGSDGRLTGFESFGLGLGTRICSGLFFDSSFGCRTHC
jgi:hypothetical protein